jgi:hypothetical protein
VQLEVTEPCPYRFDRADNLCCCIFGQISAVAAGGVVGGTYSGTTK